MKIEKVSGKIVKKQGRIVLSSRIPNLVLGIRYFAILDNGAEIKTSKRNLSKLQIGDKIEALQISFK